MADNRSAAADRTAVWTRAGESPRHGRLGRQPGYRPKSDRLAPKVLALVALGRSYRLIGRELELSKNTVADLVRRKRVASALP